MKFATFMMRHWMLVVGAVALCATAGVTAWFLCREAPSPTSPLPTGNVVTSSGSSETTEHATMPSVSETTEGTGGIAPTDETVATGTESSEPATAPTATSPAPTEASSPPAETPSEPTDAPTEPEETEPIVTEPEPTEPPTEGATEPDTSGGEEEKPNNGQTSASVPSSAFVAPADPTTGLSWDGASPIVYTYADGTTGSEPVEGATFEVVPGVIGVYTDYIVGSNTTGSVDGVFYCEHCGKKCGDGSNGTCIYWLTGGNHTCPSCGETVSGYTCHTCS